EVTPSEIVVLIEVQGRRTRRHNRYVSGLGLLDSCDVPGHFRFGTETLGCVRLFPDNAGSCRTPAVSQVDPCSLEPYELPRSHMLAKHTSPCMSDSGQRTKTKNDDDQ